MSLLETTIKSITIPDTFLSADVRTALAAHHTIDFGRLESALLRYIDITDERHPTPPKANVIISCADHGVAEESVSAYPPETTLNMMCNYLIAHGGAANAVANFAKARLVVADLGVNADTQDIPGLLHHSIARGTANMTKGAAMTRGQAVQSIEAGILLANEAADRGERCILPGEMGISNTTSSAAIVAALLQLSPEEVTGRGANISDARLRHKIEIVRRALDVNVPDPNDGLDVLTKVGGFELGCIAGLILGAAARRMLVVLDGANTTSAALIAHALAPQSAHYMLASHSSLTEHSQPHALRRLGLTPMLRLDIRLSEAAGSSIALHMLTQMLRVWDALDRPDAPMHIPHLTPAAGQNAAHPVLPPDQKAMDACQYRLDNLAKPIHSLGYLERIAVQFAGTTRNARPSLGSKSALLLLTAEDLPNDLTAVLTAMSTGADIPIHILPITQEHSDVDAAARQLAAAHPILLLGAYGASDHAALETALSAAIGSAAESGALILPGDVQTDRAAHRCAGENPDITPYLLHILPDMITLEAEIQAGLSAILGMGIIRAALHALNDMKTFTEAGVAVAIDGAGAGRQVREDA